MRHATTLQTVSVDVPLTAVAAYEAALQTVCGATGIFIDNPAGTWRVEGVKEYGADEPALAAALLVAALASGIDARLRRTEVAAEGWLMRTASAFPEQRIGHRFVIRGTHLPGATAGNRLILRLDAGAAFGSGEHGSTRGCLRALERIAPLRPRRVVDLGTGSGVLAMAAAALLHRPVLAIDIDPWAVRTTRDNVRRNHLTKLVRCVRADGWASRAIARAAPFDLALCNILARPLCAMASDLAAHLAPGGIAILAGLLASQAPMVGRAHRRAGLLRVGMLLEGDWATLILRKPHGATAPC